jgi:hypothetical protein
MVRRRSPVRVRRGLCKSAAKRRFFLRLDLQDLQRAVTWNLLWSFQIEKRPILKAKGHETLSGARRASVPASPEPTSKLEHHPALVAL